MTHYCCRQTPGYPGETKDIASANSSHGRIDLLLSVPVIKEIFKKDMQLSPTFSKLKTLVLNWWVVASEVHAIIHFFRKAPVLEKISIRLCEEREYITEIEESCRLLEEKLLPLEHLKIIEISCSTGYDGRLDKLVKFVDSRSTTVQVELPASMPEDAPVSESEMILQRRDHHYGAKAAEHFRIKWSSQPPALLAIWESDPRPAHHIYHPPVFD